MKKSKSVFISGGSRGIGFAVAEHLAAKGYDVVVAGRKQETLEIAESKLKAINGTASSVMLDVSDEAAVMSAFSRMDELYALICCAGIYGPIAKVDEVGTSQWKKTFEVNVYGSLYCVKAASSIMKKAGEGRVVLFSGGGQGAMPGFSAYVASKGAVTRFAETVAAELKENGIFVNSVAPGFVMTELQQDVLRAGPDKAGKGFFEKVKQADAEGGGVSPKYSAELCEYLLSEKARGLYGKLLSARWDPYSEFTELDKLSANDQYTLRRVMYEDGGTVPKD